MNYYLNNPNFLLSQYLKLAMSNLRVLILIQNTEPALLVSLN
jgi:hypothetical protein